MADYAKNLTINVILNADNAKAEAKKLFETLTGLSGKETFKTTVSADTTKIIKEQRTVIDSMRRDAETYYKFKEKMFVSNAQREVESLNEVRKAQQKVYSDAEKVFSQQMASARSARTTPYPFTPYDPKQWSSTTEKKLALNILSPEEIKFYESRAFTTADKIVATVQHRIRNGFRYAPVEEVEKFMNRINSIIDTSNLGAKSKIKTQVRQLFSESGITDLVKENTKYYQEMGRMANLIGVKPDVIKSWKLTREEVKSFTQVWNDLNRAVAGTSGDIVAKRIKDIRAGVIVKGQGRELGASYVSEQTVRDMDALIKKYPQLQAHIENTGISLTKQHGHFSKLVESTKNYIKFQVGWFLGAGVIFTVIGAIVSAAKEVVVFDQALRDLQAVTGATDKEVSMLADTAKRVSKETPLAATEIVKLGLQLMRAGLDIKATIGAMEAAAKVATLSGEDVKVVADTMASVFMIWKLGAEDATEAGTALAAALQYSKLTIQDFGTALNYIGGMASTMNLSLQETAGVLASISNLGVRASTMATGWRQFVASMAAPSGKLSEHLSNVHANFDKLNLLKIEGPNKMATILAELERVSFGAQEATGLVERRAAAFFLALKTVGVPALLEMKEKMSDQRAYTEGLAFAMQGLSNQTKNFRNHIMLSALSVGQVLLPALKVLVSVLTILANTLAHSISFFTSFPGVIAPLTVTLGIIIMLLKDLIALQKSVIVGLAITAWQQAVIILRSFAAVVMSVCSNVAVLGKELRNLWIIMAKNPLGLVMLAITAIVGSALLDWLMKGQTEFGKLAKKADNLTKSAEELRKKGEELRKQYPELFKDMAENAEDAADAMATYKRRIDEALKVPEYKTPKLPDNIKEWVDKNLVPARKAISGYQKDLQELEKQIRKMNAEPIKVTWFDVVKAIAKTWRTLFGFLPDYVTWIKNIWTEFINWLGKSVKWILNILGELPFLGKLKETAKNIDSILASVKAFPGKIIGYPKKVWSEFIEEIRISKVPEAKKQLEDLTMQYKKTKESLDIANAGFEKMVKEGNFAKILEQIIASTKKYTAEEQKEMVFKNLVNMITDIAATDPDRVGVVLLGMAEAYMKAADKFDRADKRMGKELANALSDRLQVARELYKDHIQEMGILQKQELEQLQHQNIMKEIEEQILTVKTRALWDKETWMLETFYKEDIMNARAYYDEKNRLLEESLAHELKLIQASAERRLIELEKQQADLIKQSMDINKRLNQIKEEILKTAGTKGPELVNLLQIGREEDIAKLTETLHSNFRDIVKGQIKDYGDWANRIKEIGREYGGLQNAIDQLIEEGILKETNAIEKNTFAQMKNNYEKQIAIALQSYKHLELQVNRQLEYNKLMLEANEIAGNWREAETLKIEILRNEGKLAQNAIDMQIAKTEAEIIGMEVMLEARGICDEYYESQLKAIKALKESLRLLGQNSEATKQLSKIREEDAEFRKNDPILWQLKQYQKEWENTNKQLEQLTQTTVQSMENAFMDFFDYTSEGFMDFGKLATSILNDIYKAVLQALIIQPLVGGFMSTLGGMFSPSQSYIPISGISPNATFMGSFSSGGIAYKPSIFGESGPEAAVPLPDGRHIPVEFKNNAMPDIKIFVNIENQTGMPINDAKTNVSFNGENYIVGVILKNIDSYGPLRHAIAGAK